MTTSQKISYAGIMCLSVFMIIAALIRLIGSVATTHETNKGTAPVWGTFWELLEACIAVIMACFLTFRSVFVKGSSAGHPGVPAAQNHQSHGSETLWERILSTLRFRSKSRRSPLITAEEGKMGEHQGSWVKPGEVKAKGHLISMANITRPTLAFSRLQTLFRSETGSEVSHEAPMSNIDVATEFDLRELDYHHVIRQEVPASTGVSFNYPGAQQGGEGHLASINQE